MTLPQIVCVFVRVYFSPVVHGVCVRNGVSPVLVLGDLRKEGASAAGRRYDGGIGGGISSGGRDQCSDFL